MTTTAGSVAGAAVPPITPMGAGVTLGAGTAVDGRAVEVAVDGTGVTVAWFGVKVGPAIITVRVGSGPEHATASAIRDRDAAIDRKRRLVLRYLSQNLARIKGAADVLRPLLKSGMGQRYINDLRSAICML